MTRATILEGSLSDELWPEIILVMANIKKRTANKISPRKQPIPSAVPTSYRHHPSSSARFNYVRAYP